MRNPFVGLRPFQTTDNDIYFGREREVSMLVNLVAALPVLVVYAPSGTGKSSLLNAGLIPVLGRDSGLLPVVVADPLEDIATKLRDALADTGWVDHALAGDVRFTELLEKHFKETGQRVVLVLDQFEERLREDRILDDLCSSIAWFANTRSEAATVVISIREDYLGGLEPLMRRIPGLLDASYRVPNLAPPELADAVYGPLAAVGGVAVEDGLIAEVLADLETETRSTDAEQGRVEAGYFQIVWSHLWAEETKDSSNVLTRRKYQAEGRATGIIKSFVSRVLADLLPLEAEMLQAAVRYLVLPTGAKVALTTDDLLGLLRRDDFTAFGHLCYWADEDFPDPATELRRAYLTSLLTELTRTSSPLFRRIVRRGREEFELVHDLLGQILLQWRLEYPTRLASAADELRREVTNRYTESQPDSPAGPVRVASEPLQRAVRNADDRVTAASAIFAAARTVTEREEGGRQLRDSLAHVWVLTLDVREMDGLENLSEKFRTLQYTLRTQATGDGPRELLRIAQWQLWELQTIGTEGLTTTRYRYASRTRLLPMLLVSLVLGPVAVIGGLALARWTLGQFWTTPEISYEQLTLGIAGFLAWCTYLAIFAEERGSEGFRGIVGTFWPYTAIAENDSPWYLFAILAWWPVWYILFEALCFAGATVFRAFDWSATAGFNVAALVSALVLFAIFLFASDY